MGRSFTSVRLGVRSVTKRWERTARKLCRDSREPGEKLTVMAKTRSSEAFFGCDTPLEAAIFSALLGIQGEHAGGEDHVDP
jgi:hypothetical protein